MMVVMPKISIRNGEFYYSGQVYGSTANILVYPGEREGLSGHDEALVRTVMTPANIDILFAVNLSVVGCEVKHWADLVDSWFSRRLHRQLATLQRLVDVGILVIRLPNVTNLALHETDMRVWEDLINAQTHRVYLLPVPQHGYLPHIVAARRALSTNGSRIFAGTDLVDRERRPGWLLRRIPSIGVVRSQALVAKYGPPWKVFDAAAKGKVAKDFGPAMERAILKALEE